MQEIIENQTSIFDAGNETAVEDTAVEDVAPEITENKVDAQNTGDCEVQPSAENEKKYSSIESLLSDEAFLEKNVYANKRICEEIIDRYIVSLKNGIPPRVMGAGGKGAPTAKVPTTLKEAKLLAEIMFSKND
ncbi:MAG: hypothetical protein IJD07_02945 [Clostridia bacterium]|nr:hypothetical protein [Clostridia bacterium]